MRPDQSRHSYTHLPNAESQPIYLPSTQSQEQWEMEMLMAPFEPEREVILSNPQMQPTILATQATPYPSTIAASQHPSSIVPPCSYRYDLSVTTNTGSQLISKSIGHLHQDAIPDWHNLQSMLLQKIVSCAPGVLDKIEYQFKYFAVILHVSAPKEKIGPLTLREESDWTTIVEEFLRITSSKGRSKRTISWDFTAEYTKLGSASINQSVSLITLATATKKKVSFPYYT